MGGRSVPIANVLVAGVDLPATPKIASRRDRNANSAIRLDDRETVKARRRLALSLQFQARYLEAEAELREIVNLHEKMLGPGDPETLRSRRDLEIYLSRMYKKADALIEYQQILKLREKVFGQEHRDTLISRVRSPASVFFGPLFRSDPAMT